MSEKKKRKTTRSTMIFDVELIEMLRKYSYYTKTDMKDILDEALRDYFKRNQKKLNEAIEEELKDFRKEEE